MNVVDTEKHVWQNLSYGQERFKEWYNLNFPHEGPIQIFTPYSHHIRPLLDHCFIVDSGPVWSKDVLETELVMISRTYSSDEEIDNPPKGLKVWRLPNGIMGETDKGTAIAVMIDDDTEIANQFLKSFLVVKTSILPHVLSLKMTINGYYIAVSSSPMEFNTQLKIMAPQKITKL